jgi:hypothetical protein
VGKEQCRNLRHVNLRPTMYHRFTAIMYHFSTCRRCPDTAL